MADVSKFTEAQALRAAGVRINHVVGQIQVLEAFRVPWPLPPGVEYGQVSAVANKAANLRLRVMNFAQTVANALPSTGMKIFLTFGTGGLYAVGAGLNKVFGLGISPSTMAGTEVLQKTLAFEAEAAGLGKELGALVGKELPGATALPEPVPGKEEESGVGKLLKYAVYGTVAYYGSRWVYEKWFSPTRANEARRLRGRKWPHYATD